MTYNQKCEYIAKSIMEGRERVVVDGDHVFFNLPSPQRTGTYFQRYTYAMLKARDIVDNTKTPTT